MPNLVKLKFMTQILPQPAPISIRSVQYRDTEVVERLLREELETEGICYSIDPDRLVRRPSSYPLSGLVRLLTMMLHPMQYVFCAHLQTSENKLRGIVRVSPFNRTRSTWRVDQMVMPAEEKPESDSPAASAPLKQDIGSQLLRHCFSTILEARTWVLETDINNKDALAIYRQNGFQPLAHMTYWQISPDLLQELADREPDLPNLLPVSNADASLLYQLDTASMPPLVRQVFDRHIFDFKTSLFGSVLQGIKNWMTNTETVSGYVFEPQRKAAIGYFQIRSCRQGSQPHQAQLTVHPAYTWLYPELMAQMARIVRELPAQSLYLVSSDYQPEREEYLERVGANRIAHTLMMSRSVWHKVRESKHVSLEGLQLSDVLQGLKPARKPIPSRFKSLRLSRKENQLSPLNVVATDSIADSGKTTRQSGSETRQAGKNPLINLPTTDFSEPPQEGPCC